MALLIIGALLVLIIFILTVLIFIIIPFMFGASYERSGKEVVKRMLAFSRIKKGEKFADLGSGDGRIVIAFAKAGTEAHGYEINPFLVLYSRWKIRKEGLRGRAFVHWRNFWNEDLGKYDVVIVFQISYLMVKLGRKLKQELKKGSRIISNKWKIRNWPIDKESDVGTGVYLYGI